MPQVFLQQPESVTGIIHLHGIYTEGVSQTMRADTSCSPGFGINQRWQSTPSGTISDYLPRSVPINFEKERITIAGCQGVDVTVEHR
jgi:hypothetical protein